MNETQKEIKNCTTQEKENSEETKKDNKKIRVEDIRRVRGIVTSIINHLNDKVVRPIVVNKSLLDNKELMEEMHLLIGDKGNVTSVIMRLSSLLVKIIPLELKMDMDDQLSKICENDRIPNEDIEIIKRFFGKIMYVYEKKSRAEK